jgi:hypothetical protein
MKIKLYPDIDGDFTIRDEHGRRIAQIVSPELAAWIVAAAEIASDYDSAGGERLIEFGPALTGPTEIEV